MAEPFTFKQFTVHQDRCAMKIGTDGVLLGAWAPLHNQPDSILDVGTGTGIIALQLAQRSPAELIDALELDDAAYEQCVANFEASDWADRLFCYHAEFSEFVTEMDAEEYDLIVANPPFYTEQVNSGSLERDAARQESSLPFPNLLEGVAKLLTPEGGFACIIPFSEEKSFLATARTYGLYATKITHVKGNFTAPMKRSLLYLTFEEKQPMVNDLVIEKERHQYTEDYINLTKDFYLKM
ncbi:tRNA1(Val) (adenine(37)-N6)-methyltransferase [Croceivirga radicis]|uniref:tRNA1(Val) (adenine(37)-N6)-methyltransferase n=1 Tax=Croceivirga radicis TaxID=1929488 RepID=UPI000255B258|nr:methyltransferase [Croceivirga radicis]